MARFFVGQRVRVVRCYHRPELLGQETRIHGFGRFFALEDGRPIQIVLDLTNPNGERIGCGSEQIEPILPEGHKASEYSLTELLESFNTIPVSALMRMTLEVAGGRK